MNFTIFFFKTTVARSPCADLKTNNKKRRYIRVRADAPGHGPSWRDHQTLARRLVAPAHAPCCLNARRVPGMTAPRAGTSWKLIVPVRESAACRWEAQRKIARRRSAGETPVTSTFSGSESSACVTGAYGWLCRHALAQGAQERRHRTLLEPRGKNRYLVEKRKKRHRAAKSCASCAAIPPPANEHSSPGSVILKMLRPPDCGCPPSNQNVEALAAPGSLHQLLKYDI